MKSKKCVIKRKGHEEVYDEKKVFTSIYAAALNCQYSDKKAKKMAEKVAKKISLWIKKSKKCIDSKEIREKVMELLEDDDVILMYKHHLDLS